MVERSLGDEKLSYTSLNCCAMPKVCGFHFHFPFVFACWVLLLCFLCTKVASPFVRVLSVYSYLSIEKTTLSTLVQHKTSNMLTLNTPIRAKIGYSCKS